MLAFPRFSRWGHWCSERLSNLEFTQPACGRAHSFQPNSFSSSLSFHPLCFFSALNIFFSWLVFFTGARTLLQCAFLSEVHGDNSLAPKRPLLCSPEKGTEKLCRQKSSREDVLAHCRLRGLIWPGNRHLRWSNQAFRCKGTQGWSLCVGRKLPLPGSAEYGSMLTVFSILL